MRKKLFSVALCATMIAGLLAGCGSGSDSDKSASSEGSVYWLNFKPEANEALQDIAKTYKDETGVDVKVLTAAQGTYEQTLTSEMEKKDKPTLFVVGNENAMKTWGSYCYDLKDTDVYNELNLDLKLVDGDGKVCSIGYCYENYGLIVNKKLLKEAGHDISEITNFESLKSVAEDIHKRSKELGFDAFTSSGMDNSSSWRFSGHLANLALFYESRDAGTWTSTPSEVKGTYLDNFKNIWDLYINNSAYDKTTLATGGYDAEAEFKEGKAVFFQNGTWEYAALSETIADEDMQMIPIYCGVEGEEKAGLCSGTENLWAVNSKASEEDIKATLDFMKWLVTSEAGTKMMAEQFGAIPYKSAADSGNVFLADGEKLINEGHYNVEWAFNYTPNVEEWRSGVVAAMNKYDAGGSWDDVKTAFISGWATQYKAANAE